MRARSEGAWTHQAHVAWPGGLVGGAVAIDGATAVIGAPATQRESEGWALFNQLKATRVVLPTASHSAKKGMATCETWQSTRLLRVRVMLEATHPDLALYFFHDFVLGKGMEAVLNGATFLQRRDAPVHGKGRKATRMEDTDALAIIEGAGMTKPALAELDEAVRAAQSAAATVDDGSTQTEIAAARLQALRRSTRGSRCGASWRERRSRGVISSFDSASRSAARG